MKAKTQPHPEMTALLKRFPVLKTKLDYWPYDLDLDYLLAVYRGSSSGEQAAIEFLLSVWDSGRDWTQAGFRSFNLARAMGTWGGPSCSSAKALMGWIEAPFHP